jgi:hypothetical protein
MLLACYITLTVLEAHIGALHFVAAAAATPEVLVLVRQRTHIPSSALVRPLVVVPATCAQQQQHA